MNVYFCRSCDVVTCLKSHPYLLDGNLGIHCLLVFMQVDQATPDVPLPGLNQKGKEADAIGSAPGAPGPGATDQVNITDNFDRQSS